MRVLDPYAVAGTYRKAQLHCHTRRSRDGAFEPLDLARRYQDAGYAFVVFTDHDRVTRCDEAAGDGFLALPGVEESVRPWLPIVGPHLGRLLVDHLIGAGPAAQRVRRTLDGGGVPCLHHPSWTGNLWTGAWPASTMASLPGPFLVEIWNPHSRHADDVRRWAAAVRAHGARARITATAGDDCHTAGQFNRAWMMVKTQQVSASALRDALLSGACYASTGVAAEFGAPGRISVQSTADEVRIYDAAGRPRHTLRGGSGQYEPAGDETFVWLECRAGSARAWSQAFWLVPDE